MEKFKVSFTADNQQLKAIGTKHASDTYADIEAEFVLGNRWTDMDSVSAVWWNDFTRIATVLDSQGKCIVPHEVLTRKGCVRVNLVGSVMEGDELVTRLTSYSAEAVQVNEKIKLTGTETSEITPSQYEQFVANVKADADRAEAGATASANSAQNASESATASANSASDSAQSAIASAQSAQNASESAITAENAKDDAEDARDKILSMRATAETLEAGSDATASYSDGLLTLGIPRGGRGEQGIQGETGATPNLTIGTVETLAPTEDATASITGTAENPVLNLGLPKGDTGEVSQAEFDEAITNLKSELNQGFTKVYEDKTAWYNGQFNDSGAFTESMTYASPTNAPLLMKAGETLKIETNGKNYSLYLYKESSGTYTRDYLFYNNSEDRTIYFERDAYIGLQFFGGGNMTPDKIVCNLYKKNIIGKAYSEVSELYEDVLTTDMLFITGYYTSSGYTDYTKRNVTYFPYKVFKGNKIVVNPNNKKIAILTFETADSTTRTLDTGWKTSEYTFDVTEDCYVRFVVANIDDSIINTGDIVQTATLYKTTDIEDRIAEINSKLDTTSQLILSPTITNGSGGNPGNPTVVTARAIPLVLNAPLVSVHNSKPVKASGNYYLYTVGAYIGNTFYYDRLPNLDGNDNEELWFSTASIIGQNTSIDGFSVTVKEFDSSGNAVTLRDSDFANYPLVIRYIYDDMIDDWYEANNHEVNHKLLNARHATAPLTLLHFSDLHADSNALKRIITYGKEYDSLIDDYICTGDMVANSYEQITSWWDDDVMTCIGNHDTASYSESTGYNWTALSMADRDAYYIAPFESNWGITHIAGTSYYYKDYSTAKVRLIVMDSMLYNDNGAEATAQTAWMSDLLADAITNNLHVLIAIHSPHGGATAKECSFSRYNQTEMPTYSDCNTPQSVVDAVASAKSNGLHFIGYIVGHTHQDNVWDAENDGSQLMYCITCASTTTVQWKNSDQDRSNNVDAFNLVTIDTANTLVKIIRGGGADIDDKMRSRKAICFNYTTGEMVGEVL